ncbi:MAG: tRNA 2-selenouridine(34) synthase MnmH [Mariniblastus sp.]
MTNEPANPTIEAIEFWALAKEQTILDVRSPSEFAKGHVPGAKNLPLFDDEQRADVGTIYKNSGKEAAVLRGLKYAGQKMADLVVQAKTLADGDSSMLVHCWRGGMRSQSVGWLLRTAGMDPRVLDGGYKSFRQFAQTHFSMKWNLRVISGLTGAGKTRVLHLLKNAGEQVVDLEGLANHRGSAFGGIGQPIQPSTEHFENQLFCELDLLDPEKPIWVEDEGNRIGAVVVPNEFHNLLRHSPGVFLDSSPSHRVGYLIEDYGDLDLSELEISISKIRKRLGPQHADEAIESVRSGNVKRAIEIVLNYYDKTYTNAANSMPRPEMPTLSIDELSDEQIVSELANLSGAV